MPHPLSTGIKTEGIGKRTTAHLNLTKTMEPSPYVYRNEFSRSRLVERHRKRERRNANKAAFAGGPQ